MRFLLRSPYRPYLRRAAAAFVLAVLSAYLLEFLLGFYFHKSVLRYPLPPGSRQFHKTIDYSVTYRYNNLGLRSDDFEAERTYDIVLLGDSFLFGQGVRQEKTVYGLLRKKGLSVLNLSEIATNPIDYLHKWRVMKGEGLKTRVLVVGLFMGNDFQGIGDKRIADALAYDYGQRPLTYDMHAFASLERLRYRIRKKWVDLYDRFMVNHSSGYRERVIAHAFEGRKSFHEDWLRFFTDDNPDMMRAMVGFEPPSNTSETAAVIDEDAYMDQSQINPDSVRNTVEILNAIAVSAKPAAVHLLLIPTHHFADGFRSERYAALKARLIQGLDPDVRPIDLAGMTPDMFFAHDHHWNEKGHVHAVRLVLDERFPKP